MTSEKGEGEENSSIQYHQVINARDAVVPDSFWSYGMKVSGGRLFM